MMASTSSFTDKVKPKEWDIMGKMTLLTLELRYKNLKQLPDELFELKDLEALDLSRNMNMELSNGLIKLTNLKLLSLAGCNLATVPAAVMKLPQLETLILSNNENITLPDDMSGLVNLTAIHLDWCNLDSLPPVVLKLSHLRSLDLSGNEQISLPDELCRLENIKELRLYACFMATVPPAVLKLTQLEKLNLSGNWGIHLPDGLSRLTNIRVLILLGTGMDTVPSVAWRLTQLERLYLSLNPLQTSTLPAKVGHLTNIKHLHLSHCQLHTLPPEVGRLTQLEWLDLSSNPLQTLPAEVGQLTKVKHLDLSYCQLHTLPPEVGRLTQLERLDLRNNPIQTLPVEVGQLTNIKHLKLSHCQLHTLPPEVGRLTQLEWLDLSSNPLQTLPAEVGQLTNVSYLHVSGNPLIKPPSEVCRQGISAIRRYFDELERSEENVSARLKVVVLGEKMAGKTSLVQTLRRGVSSLTEEEDRTHCVEVTQWAPDYNITFEVYDFGGHDVYHLTHQFFLTPDAFYLLLVNLETYSCSEQCYTETVGFWLDTLNARVPGAVVSLVGSKEDRCQPDDVIRKTTDIQKRTKMQTESWESIARLTSQQRGSSGSIKGISQQDDCLSRQGLRIVGNVLCVSAKPTSWIWRLLSRSPSWVSLKNHLLETGNNKTLFPTLRRVLPKTWMLFQRLLQVSMETSEHSEKTLRRTKRPPRYWLTSTECERIGNLAELSLERLEPVLSYLQQVGTILRYTDIPELKGLVFHDPPALIEIFKDLFHHDTKALFSTPRFANLTSSQLKTFQSDISDRGLIQKEVMTRLLPSDINLDIVTALMQNFGLCFEIQDEADPSKHSCLYRIPWYLQNQMPEELMSVWPANVPDEQEQLQLMCDIRGFCPRGLFQRFSVGIHPLVKDRTDWKDGVMAYRQDYHVLVCSKPAAGDTYITMATRGRPDQAGEMWGVVHPLLEVLVQLLREWSGVLYSLHVTCAHCIKARLDNPHQYNLRDRTADDGRDVRCPHPEVKYTASTSADLVYRPGGIRGWKQNFRALQGSSTVNADVSGSPGGDFNRLRWLLTEVKVKDDAYDDHYNRLAAHVTELGLRFRPEARGDHLSDFIPNQTWEEYLDTMSRDGTWGDHVVLQAMADMLGRDVIIVSSVEADNYVTVLHPQSQTSPRISLLLGHYAENHYASLDVLLLNDEYGTSKGGISTINCQLGQILVAAKAVVYCTALRVPKQDQEAADRDGVKLIQAVQLDKESVPTLDWLTKYHSVHYPGLPLHVTCIIGHADITDTAARNIWEQRYPQADLMTFNHVLPEDTEYYKGGRKAMKAWEKEKDMLDKCDNAKAAFSVGKRIYDHFDTMYKGKKKPKNHQIFLPKPSKIFLDATVRPGGEQKVVLCIGRVRKVEKLKGHDLVAQSMRDVVKEIKNVRLRVRGISEDDWETSQKILEDNLNSPDLNPTLLPYGTQEDIRDDMMTAHLVLMPSRSEPFGLVGLEAIAAGIPVLISDKTGLSGMILDLIEQKKLSAEHRHVIVETSVNDFDRAGDAKRWADRIVDILNHSDSEFEKAARLKRELVESRYWEESHRTFLQACGIPAGAADL
uniref:Leucine-rich repeat protein SHOC-2 n=1 Tax=Branchiostoma floridae TaxID=7739 RepID=C3YRK2_BRAFL|eukprot:XP_002601187.1 hypothetical protein BRAFLDRAFT_75632 [Branchiostoma floridae]